MINLMSHTLKVLLIIIQQRIYRKYGKQLDEVYFGFRAGEALFAITVQKSTQREYQLVSKRYTINKIYLLQPKK